MTLITYLTRVHFADGVLEDAIRVETARLSRPLVVTDRGVAEANLVARLLGALAERAEARVFELSQRDPSEADARAALALFRESASDGLIALGGGSVIDLGKAVRLLHDHECRGGGGPLSQYAACEGGGSRIRASSLPLLAVPTTAGSGSEVGPEALIAMDSGRKLTFFSRHLIPSAAICDPTLTVGLPPDLTAGTGMDALSHCIETFIASSYNPPADGIALDGMGRAARNLERAVEEGSDLGARREMMAASLNGALALQKGLGAIHAASHGLCGLPGHALHHGTVNAIVLPHVLEFNAPAVGERLEAVGAALGVSRPIDLPGALERLADAIALPPGLGALGVSAADIEAAAPLAELDRHNRTNPRRARASDYARLMRAAL